MSQLLPRKSKTSLIMLFLIFSLSNLYSVELSVKITSPYNKARFEACSNITLSADASIDVGEIRDVNFSQNGFALKADRTVPYEYIWENVPAGIYEIVARVRDKENNTASSDPILIFVGDIEDGNLLTNGNFDCGTNWSWVLSEQSGSQASIMIDNESWLSDDGTAAVISIQNTGTVAWSVQFYHKFTLQANHTYEISFVADVFQPKQIEVNFQGTSDPWEVYWNQVLTLTEFGEFGPFRFDCPIDAKSIDFKFVLSYDTTTIYLDDIRIIDLDWTNVNAEEPVAIRDFQLLQNFPNPFNPETTIKFALDNTEKVQLSIYNMLGEQITTLVDEVKMAGMHEIGWNGRDDQGELVNSGVYVYKLKAGDKIQSHKMLLLK